MQVAQCEVAEIERPLTGQRQVGGERSVAAQPVDPPPLRLQGKQRTLRVVQGLRLAGVGQPIGHRLLVGFGQLGGIEVGTRAVGCGQRKTGDDAGATPPRAGHRQSQADAG